MLVSIGFVTRFVTLIPREIKCESLLFAGYRQSLNSRSFSLELDVRISPQHSRANTPGNIHDHAVWYSGFTESRNRGMAQIMKPNRLETRFLRQCAPGASPAMHRAGWVEAYDLHLACRSPRSPLWFSKRNLGRNAAKT